MAMKYGNADVEKVEINPCYLTEAFSTEFKNTLAGITEFSTPFPHFSLSNFLTDAKFVDRLCAELAAVKWSHKENDLYSLNQTADFATFDSNEFPALVKYREFIRNDVRKWIEKISSNKLNTEVALTGSLYNYTDVLLPHDDQLEGRKFAFILYLVDEAWNVEDGGQLKLYNYSGDYIPLSVSREIIPKRNMFNIFPVSQRSWHMVSEVLSPGAKRLSINGWFHADDVVPVRSLTAAIFPVRRPHMDITFDELLGWINPVYMIPSEQARIRRSFERHSEIELTNFISKEKYGELLVALEACQFDQLGPPNKRSRAITLLLSQWTGLNLHPLMDDDTEETERGDGDAPYTKRAKLEKEIGAEQLTDRNFRDVSCRALLSRFKKGCYTLADDQLALDTDRNGYCLDLLLFLGAEKWNNKSGGFISYIAKDDVNEVLRVYPTSNSAALVYREPDVFPFMKYINEIAKGRCYYLLGCSFLGMHGEEDADQSNDDDNSEETDETEESEGSDDTEMMEQEDDLEMGEQELDDGEGSNMLNISAETIQQVDSAHSSVSDESTEDGSTLSSDQKKQGNGSVSH